MAGKKQKTDDERIIPDTPEKITYVKNVVARGEAVRANPDGSLPLHATHEIVGVHENGLPILIRRRFN